MSIKKEFKFTPLPEPILITQQEWPEGTLPLVHTRHMTFNHENYIRDCIEGVLLQKTTFPVQVLIHDDCSTDKTGKIVREYELRYPKLIKAYYQEENTYRKPDRHEFRKTFKDWRIGKYEAICEGDDYWTDPLKLQKQVDFLERNLDCSMCFHAANLINENKNEASKIKRPRNIPADSKFEMKDAILGGGAFMSTNSMLFYRKHINDFPEWIQKAPVGDLPLTLLLASKGNLGYIDEVMSVYRVNAVGSWSSKMNINRAKVKKHHYGILKMWTDFDDWADKKYSYYVFRKKTKNRLNYQKGKLKYLIKYLFQPIYSFTQKK